MVDGVAHHLNRTEAQNLARSGRRLAQVRNVPLDEHPRLLGIELFESEMKASARERLDRRQGFGAVSRAAAHPLADDEAPLQKALQVAVDGLPRDGEGRGQVAALKRQLTLKETEDDVFRRAH